MTRILRCGNLNNWLGLRGIFLSCVFGFAYVSVEHRHQWSAVKFTYMVCSVEKNENVRSIICQWVHAMGVVLFLFLAPVTGSRMNCRVTTAVEGLPSSTGLTSS